MPHAPENTLEAAVEQHVQAVLSPEDLAYQVHLPDTGREADFVAVQTTPPNTSNLVYAIEVENDWEAVMKGVGQALLYAGHFDRGIPVVAFPEGHVEQPEYDDLRAQAPGIIFMEVPYDE